MIVISVKQLFFLAFSVDRSNVFYFETSAKDSTNVEKVFETPINSVLARELKIVSNQEQNQSTELQ
jgi:GTPase SAR1 family protein